MPPLQCPTFQERFPLPGAEHAQWALHNGSMLKIWFHLAAVLLITSLLTLTDNQMIRSFHSFHRSSFQLNEDVFPQNWLFEIQNLSITHFSLDKFAFYE